MLNAAPLRKSILPAALSLLLSGHLFAQDAKVKFGIQTGVSISKLRVTAQKPTSEYTGPFRLAPAFYLGVVLDIPLLKTWSLSAGPKAIGKSVYVSGEPVPEFQDKGYKNFSYAELPVQIVKHFDLGKIPLFIGAGGYLSYLISGNEHQEWNAYNGGTMAYDLFKNKDAGLLFTAGGRVSNKLSIIAGYESGMPNVLKNEMEPENQTQLKTLSFTLGIQASL